MNQGELEAWRTLLVEQRTLWKVKRAIEAELETVTRRMEELAMGLPENPGTSMQHKNIGTN